MFAPHLAHENNFLSHIHCASLLRRLFILSFLKF
jgi:hypothetical protein